MWAMLTHALYLLGKRIILVGKRIIGGEPYAEVETASMKLLARSDVELDVAVGSVVLASFWTSSSDMDLVFQLAVGIVVSCRLTQQLPKCWPRAIGRILRRDREKLGLA